MSGIQNTTGFIEDYVNNSTVTGLVYFIDSRHWIEKIWWFSVFVGVIGCFVISTRSVYITWQEDPAILVFNDRTTHIWDIPFPAITVCPSAKLKNDQFCSTSDNANQCSEFYEFIRKNIDLVRDAAALVCYNNLNLSMTNQPIADSNAYKTIHKLALKRDNTLGYCMNTLRLSCERMFYETMLDDGLCFSFNMLKHSEIWRDEVSPDFEHQLQHGIGTDWSTDTGYNNFVLQDLQLSYPVRVVGTKLDEYNVVSFSLTHHKANEVKHCDHPPHGHKILLHSPDEYPIVLKNNFHTIEIDQIAEIFIKPRIIQASDDLLYTNPRARKCYFNSERYLRYFKIYNQRNCQIECLANITLSVCGCVSFALPRNSLTPVCGLSSNTCYKQIKDRFFNNGGSFIQRDDCNCLPNCRSTDYDVDYQMVYESGQNTTFSLSLVLLSFKDTKFDSQKRLSRTGTLDFLSYSAGLLGLYMGMSLLSIVEFFYFFTVRLMCFIRRMN